MKTGDIVRIIGNSNNHSYRIGSIVELGRPFEGLSSYDGDIFHIVGRSTTVVRDYDMELEATADDVP